MINSYYAIIDGEQTGPFSHRELMDNGLTPDTLVLSPIAKDWQSAGNLPEFNSYFESIGIYSPFSTKTANFGWRLLAYIIDIIILMMCLAIFEVLLLLILQLLGKEAYKTEGSSELTLDIVLFVVYIIYNAIFESSRLQGSIGKTVCKLKVVNMLGMRISFHKALVRNSSKILSSLLCYIGFLTIFWDAHHQGWHDGVAKTYVVKIK